MEKEKEWCIVNLPHSYSSIMCVNNPMYCRMRLGKVIWQGGAEHYLYFGVVTFELTLIHLLWHKDYHTLLDAPFSSGV